ncbi:MAG: hypothetical protein J6C81_05760 [Muribaculaceae bacterium]|nr:hypothetical protein [Muribaculaceae bacterium]
MKTKKSRKKRIELIVNIIRNRCVSSQEELLSLLAEQGCSVTQGTLSRDLRSLKTTKVPTDRGVAMYVLPESNSLKDKLLSGESLKMNPNYQSGFVSLQISGNMAVIKTRNGYAAGLAYDLDISKTPEILGTIPGTDTIFAVLREDVTPEKAQEIFSRLLPVHDFDGEQEDMDEEEYEENEI